MRLQSLPLNFKEMEKKKKVSRNFVAIRLRAHGVGSETKKIAWRLLEEVDCFRLQIIGIGDSTK